MRTSLIFRIKLVKFRWLLIGLLAAVWLICLVRPASALNPERPMSQYKHDFWGIEKGLTGGTVHAIAQTPDGYLWLGTEKGLVRFDGVNFNFIQFGDKNSAAAESIIGLFTDAEGTLWIQLRSPKILRYRNGKFDNVLTNLSEADYLITAMSAGNNGTVLLSKLEKGLFRYSEEKTATLISRPALPPSVIISLAENDAGEIWMGTREAGLFRLDGRQITQFADGLPDRKINCLLPDGNQNLWVGTDNGIAFWNGAKFIAPGNSSGLKNSRVLKILKDNQSNLWVGTESNGLWRVSGDGAEAIKNTAFPSEKTVTALFEDREGSLWVGTPEGIERWRDNAFITYSTDERLPPNPGGTILTDSAMTTWFAPSSGGLYRLKNNQIDSITAAELARDVVYSITGDRDDFWLGRQRGGLSHLYFDGSNYTLKTFTPADGLAQNSVFSVYQSRDGSVWAGTLTNGASRFKNGIFTNFTIADGLAANTISAITETIDGTIWLATPNGLSSFYNDRWRNYTTADGLPTDKINTLFSDSKGVLWIGTTKGLAFFRNGKIQFDEAIPALLRESIFGLAEDKDGDLWIAASNKILRAEREKILNGTADSEDVREFGISDGLLSVESVMRDRSVVTDAAGRIWFSLSRGISVVDPNRLKINLVPVPIHVESIAADGAAVDLQNPARISGGHQRIVFNFAGVSLATPERVRYRYKLDGFDREWSEPSSQNAANYTNLAPGTYRFQVMANNGDGDWNGGDAAIIDLIIEPLYWQTWWFRALCVLLACLVLASIYFYRLHSLTAQLNLRFAERLTERTRIAQELHDTLLQGVFSTSMQIDAVVEQLEEHSPVKPQLTRLQEMTGQILSEGRNTVRGLHSPRGKNFVDLEKAFIKIRQDLDLREKVEFRLITGGTSRAIHPIVRDEIYRIGREALINAFRHSEADRIEVEIEYAEKYFRLLIGDDGVGIKPEFIRAGRDGHLGLSGMRDRAAEIGAKLKIMSRSGNGTEIELLVPQQIAYETFQKNSFAGWLERVKSLFQR